MILAMATDAQKRAVTDTQTAESPARSVMPVTAHLRELRRRSFFCILIVLVLFIAAFVFVQPLVDLLLKLGDGFSFVYLAPAELVTAYMHVAFVAALCCASPFLLFEIWAFIAPGLTDAEKRKGVLALIGGFLFFLFGAAFCYFIILPFTLDFFVRFNTSQAIEANISFASYLRFVLGMLAAFGALFEFPMLTILLSQAGVLKPAYMVSARKYAVLIIFILAAVITPPDAVSQIVAAVPMILLYEISILLCRITAKKRNNEKNS